MLYVDLFWFLASISESAILTYYELWYTHISTSQWLIGQQNTFYISMLEHNLTCRVHERGLLYSIRTNIFKRWWFSAHHTERLLKYSSYCNSLNYTIIFIPYKFNSLDVLQSLIGLSLPVICSFIQITASNRATKFLETIRVNVDVKN